MQILLFHILYAWKFPDIFWTTTPTRYIVAGTGELSGGHKYNEYLFQDTLQLSSFIKNVGAPAKKWKTDSEMRKRVSQG